MLIQFAVTFINIIKRGSILVVIMSMHELLQKLGSLATKRSFR